MQKNTEKLTDKAFLRLMISSIAGILLCMTFLCSTTWAWFADDVIEKKNQIIPAQGNLEIVSVACPDGSMMSGEALEALLSNSGVDLAEGTYTVTLKKPAGSSSGYFVVRWNNNVYYSDGLIRDPDNDVEVVESYRFTVPSGATLNGARVEVRWGIYSGDPHIEKLIIDSNGSQIQEIFIIPVPSEMLNGGSTDGSENVDKNGTDTGAEECTGTENGSENDDQ